MKAIEVSKYIIAKFDNAGDLITNKKLQKLLYYIEAWSSVHFEPVIDEDFEAWVHGPVIPNVYREFKKFGYSFIKIDYKNGETSTDYIQEFEKSNHLKPLAIEIIDAVLKKYGVLSSQELELLSHSETPWQKTRKGLSPLDYCSNVIEKKLIKEYYTSLISA